MPKTKVLITVKTYPTFSAKYNELVCTAGVLEDGSWIRIYPVPFRKKSYDQQYKKYDWIELDLVKNSSDPRPESYRPQSNEAEIKIDGHIDSDGEAWHERRKYVLRNVYYDMEQLIQEAKDKNIATSLATYKPYKIEDFTWKEVEREWPKDKLENLKQLQLFEKKGEGLDVVKKLPYKFYYTFQDIKGKKSTMMIEDWEAGQLFWNCLKRCNSEEEACRMVKGKYLDDFAKTKDLYFFLGTTQANHFRAPNPFIIIGTFHPKPVSQMKLEL